MQNVCKYTYITSSAYRLLDSVLNIYSIYNVNSRLAVELQSTYRITFRKFRKITKKDYYALLRLEGYISKMLYYSFI